MGISSDFIEEQYEELSVLSLSERGKTYLIKEKNGTKLYIKRVMDARMFELYQKLKSIDDRHLPHINNVFEEDGKCIEIEEFISGDSLEWIVAHHRLSVAETAKCASEICEGLEKVHQAGIVHRDIKPENIILSTDNVVKILDFDISRTVKSDVQRDTIILGTAGYAAPEQFGFMQSDGRTDIYSIGILMKNVLDRNYNTGNYAKMQRIIKKCTMIDPQKRYRDVVQLRKDLASISGIYKNNSFSNMIDKVDRPGVGNEGIERKGIRTIPGFRTMSLWKMAIASICYCIVGAALIETDVKYFINPILMVTTIVGSILMFVVPYMITFDIFGILKLFTKKDCSTRSICAKEKIKYSIISFLAGGTIFGFTAAIFKV